MADGDRAALIGRLASGECDRQRGDAILSGGEDLAVAPHSGRESRDRVLIEGPAGVDAHLTGVCPASKPDIADRVSVEHVAGDE